MKRAEFEIGELAERVRKLESQNRRWKLASFFLLFIVAPLLATNLVAQERNTPALLRAKAVEAQSFLLEDSEGNARAQMKMKAAGPSFEIYDQTGKIVWSIPSKPMPKPTR
jgi:hypothetical protein